MIAKLEERGVDDRCIDFWRSHPECHADLIDVLENEELPPGREAGRDESPYWMSKMKWYLYFF